MKRHDYAEWIAEVVRYALKGSDVKGLPEDAIIVANYWDTLGGYNDLIGLPVYKMNTPSAFAFSLAFGGEIDEKKQLILKYFNEGIGLFEPEISD